MAKTAVRSVEVDSLDRLEDKIKRLVAMVERIKVWTPELLQRIETAARENDGIQNCFDMPDRIRALVRRHSGRD